MGRRNYNNNLLTILISLTVIVCVVFAAIIVMGSQDKQDSPVKENKENVATEKEEELREEPAKEEEEQKENPEQLPVPEEVPDEKEPEKPQTKKPETDEKEPEKTDKADESDKKDVAPETNDDSGWNLILANPWNSLPEGFTVELTEIGSGHKVDSRIVNDLNSMMSDLRKAGHSAFVCSSYRTNAHQTNLYNNEVKDYKNQGYSDEDAAVEAAKWVAIPGTSEHQTGLAVDIMSSYYLVLDRGQEDTAEQQWLMANSYKYGFILRYPSDKSDITGIYYEPWHYRYVGKKAAKEIFEKGICFEEYLLL